MLVKLLKCTETKSLSCNGLVGMLSKPSDHSKLFLVKMGKKLERMEGQGHILTFDLIFFLDQHTMQRGPALRKWYFSF